LAKAPGSTFGKANYGKPEFLNGINHPCKFYQPYRLGDIAVGSQTIALDDICFCL
jgi:hypothetical protein